MPEIKPDIETFAKIKVVGVGGGGNAAINRMIKDKIRGVDFLAINTDAQALHHSQAGKKLHIGKSTTRGLGAGMSPDVGKKSAEESQNDIHDTLRGSDMIFITCGLGGGTGTGAAPLIADVARDVGALTVAVVTKPFSFEGLQRMDIAESGLEELQDKVDTIITIPNDRILQIVDKKTTLLDAFGVVDEVLKQGVQGISEIITMPGLINVDFADVKAIMKDSGSALMGIGRASGDNRATEAAKMAIDSPLLELSIDGARGVLFTVTGGKSLGMHEVSEAAKVITEMADNDAKIIFGANIDESLKDEIIITVVATGFAGGVSRLINESAEPSAEKSHFFEQPDVEETPKQNLRQTKNFRAKLERDSGDETKSEQTVDLSFDDKTEDNATEFERKSNKEENDEEDKKLDIPAFIRKKMG